MADGVPKTKAAAAALEEQQKKVQEAYMETANLLNADAARSMDAAQMASLEQLTVETTKRTERVKGLKAKAMLISAENISKQELIDSMSLRLEDMSKELSRMSLLQIQAAGLQAKRGDDAKAVALQGVMEATISRAVHSREDKGDHNAELFSAYAQHTGPRSTPVYFCPHGQPREAANSYTTFRLGRATNFRELTTNAARFFGLPLDVALLEDENHSIWPLDVVVWREISRYRGDQTLRLVQRDDANEVREAQTNRNDRYDGEVEELGTGQLLKMLGGGSDANGKPATGGDADEDAEREQQAAMQQLAAMGEEESDSDDDANQNREYVEPPLNMRKETKDLIFHLIFLSLLILSTTNKRSIPAANSLFAALETIFVEEEFGDYNEKSFIDVANFEEAWDWTESVMMPGLFESDVDDSGNIMMYNQLVGAVRLRQQRVSNTSCVQSDNIQRRVQVGTFQFTESFYFRAPDLGDGGGCFSEYTAARRDTTDFGPCTPEGRDALAGAEGDLDQYNASCAGSGFEWWSAARTRAPPITFMDGSGYVRDILPEEPREGRDTPQLPAERLEETLNELKSFLWLDERTRAFIVSFSVYNANFNLYAACNFIFQFTAGGTINPSYRFKVMKLDLYENVAAPEDLLQSSQFLYDVAVNALLVRLLLKELGLWFHIRWNYGTSAPYFSSVWNLLEIANIAPFFFAWATRIGFLMDPNLDLYRRGMFATQRYAEIGTAALSYGTAFNFDSISILVSFLKLFKYFRLSAKFALLSNVLLAAGRDMAFFFIMLALFLFGFVVFAQEMFGTQLNIYSDSLQSATTLLKIIFGVVDIYWDMIRTATPGLERMIAMVFFLLYVIWMFFIFINIFLAILNDAYSGVKGRMQDEEDALRAEKELAAANGVEEKSAVMERLAAMRSAAQGRMSRFQSRLSRMAKRRRAKTATAMDAIQGITAHGVAGAELDALNRELEELRGRKRRKGRTHGGGPPP